MRNEEYEEQTSNLKKDAIRFIAYLLLALSITILTSLYSVATFDAFLKDSWIYDDIVFYSGSIISFFFLFKFYRILIEKIRLDKKYISG